MELIKLIERINERVMPQESQSSISEIVPTNGDEQMDDIQAEGPALQTGKRARAVRQPGCRREERLGAARNALSRWCQAIWKTEYSHCIWGPEVLLPDTVLTKLASRARIKTISDIKNEVPEWLWVDEYGEAVLKLLEPIDAAWHEENERKKTENKAKRAKVSADKRVKREEDRLVKARQATVQRRASQDVHGPQTSIQQHQSVFPVCFPLASHSEWPAMTPCSSTQPESSNGMFYSFRVAL